MAKVRDRRLVSTYGSRVLDGGFYSIPNLILDYQKELDLSNAELVFFIKVTHFFKRDILKDNELNMPITNRAIKNVRKSLINKGYLKCEVVKNRDEKGKIRTEGIIYDWSGLIQKMNEQPRGKNVKAPRGSFFPCYNENRGEVFSDVSLYGKEGVKEGSKQKNGEAAALILKLTKRGLDGELANQMVSKFPSGWIEEKIEAFDRLNGRIRSPGAWLRKAIEANDGANVQEVSKENLRAAKERYEKMKEAVRDGKDVVI